MSVTTVKLVTALVIFLCGWASTLCPLFLANKSEAVFSVGNMMASGVLLAAGLCHQLADSTESLEAISEHFPWSFFLCGTTFLLFMVFEETVHLLLVGEAHNHGGIVETEETMGSIRESAFFGSHSHHSCRGSILMTGGFENIDESKTDYTQYGATTVTHSHDHHRHDEQVPLKPRRVSNAHYDPSSFRPTSSFRASHPRLSHLILGDNTLRPSVHHHHDDHISEHLHGSFLASVMLLLALSVHSILAGLSMGLVNRVQSITSSAIAIIAHKVFAGYALGSTMVAAELVLERHLLLSLIFSLSTPLGIFIGMLCGTAYDEGGVAIGIVEAVVAGTFLYVAIIEVGMKELLICRHDVDTAWNLSLSEKQMEAVKLGGMLVGYLAMSFLALFI